MSNNAHDLSKRLLNALDNSYNVVDMQAVNEIISILEKFNITKELLETTRLGKHVNELRRKTTDPTLARRAKVLVKRWRNLVIPGATSSPAHPAPPGSNRSSAERTMRRLGGTPLTSPALSRQVLSPAVPSPRPPSRPAWGGYESDSQDVILVDDDPPPPVPPLLAPPAPAPPPSVLSPAKRPPSPGAQSEERKAKRDKKPKKRRGHSRAGSGSEAPAGEPWGARNGSSPPPAAPPPHAPAPPPPPHAHAHARKNGVRPVDAYSALVNRMPPAGGKKVKTTKELLEDIQSRGGAKPVSQPPSPGSPDVMFIEPDVKVDSPLRNGGTDCRLLPAPTPLPAPLPPEAPPRPPLEDERPFVECTCGEEEASPLCPAARNDTVYPGHVRALHHAYLPGINGTRAPPHPHKFAVRPPTDPDKPGLFTSVVPLYMYSDHADDYCVKNMSRVPLCTHLPWTEFAPAPPSPAPLPPPPSPRPYPLDTLVVEVKEEPNGEDATDDEEAEADVAMLDLEESITTYKCPKIEAEMVSVPVLEPSERLKAPILSAEDEELVLKEPSEAKCKVLVASEFASEPQEHRTVERTKEVTSEVDGRTLYALCESTRRAIPYEYGQTSATPVVTLPLEVTEAVTTMEESLAVVEEATERDDFGRPLRPTNFTEWHECAQLGDLIALPYVVID